MKTCTRFHIEDVEPGDRLFLGDGQRQEFEEEVDPDITITVQRVYRTHNFGWCVDAVEPRTLAGGEDFYTYYLNDYDIIRPADKEVSTP